MGTARGLRMVRTLPDLAIRKASRVVSTGISNWQTSRSAARMTSRAACTSVGDNPRFPGHDHDEVLRVVVHEDQRDAEKRVSSNMTWVVSMPCSR